MIPGVPLRHEDLGIERALPFCHHHVLRAMAVLIDMDERQQRELQPSTFGIGRRLDVVHLVETGQQCSSVATQHWHVRAAHIADDPMRNFLVGNRCSDTNSFQVDRAIDESMNGMRFSVSCLHRVCRHRNHERARGIPLELLLDGVHEIVITGARGMCNNRACLSDHRRIAI